jgi:hypothetical protein
MNEHLKARIAARLDALSDEAGRQLMDYLEFLESRYNRSRRAPSVLQRLAESLDDALGSGRLGEAAARGTAQVVDTAGRVMAGLVAAGRAVAGELSGGSVAPPAQGSAPTTGGSNGAPPPEGPDAPNAPERG